MPIQNPPRSPRLSSAHAGRALLKRGKAAFAPALRHSPHLPPPPPAHSVTSRSSRVTRYVFTATRPRWSRRAPRARGVPRRRIRGKRVGFVESRPRSGVRRTRRVAGTSVATPLERTACARITRDATLARVRGPWTLAEATRRVRRAPHLAGKSNRLRCETHKTPSTRFFGLADTALTSSLPARPRRPSQKLHVPSTCPAFSLCTRPSPSSRSARSSAWASPSAAASP